FINQVDILGWPYRETAQQGGNGARHIDFDPFGDVLAQQTENLPDRGFLSSGHQSPPDAWITGLTEVFLKNGANRMGKRAFAEPLRESPRSPIRLDRLSRIPYQESGAKIGVRGLAQIVFQGVGQALGIDIGLSPNQLPRISGSFHRRLASDTVRTF